MKHKFYLLICLAMVWALGGCSNQKIPTWVNYIQEKQRSFGDFDEEVSEKAFELSRTPASAEHEENFEYYVSGISTFDLLAKDEESSNNCFIFKSYAYKMSGGVDATEVYFYSSENNDFRLLDSDYDSQMYQGCADGEYFYYIKEPGLIVRIDSQGSKTEFEMENYIQTPIQGLFGSGNALIHQNDNPGNVSYVYNKDTGEFITSLYKADLSDLSENKISYYDDGTEKTFDTVNLK